MSQGFGSKRIQLSVPYHIIHRHSSSLPSEVRVPTKRLKFSLPCHSWPLVSSPCKQSGSGDKVPISASDVRPWFGLLLQKSDSAHSINEDCHTNSHSNQLHIRIETYRSISMFVATDIPDRHVAITLRLSTRKPTTDFCKIASFSTTSVARV